MRHTAENDDETVAGAISDEDSGPVETARRETAPRRPARSAEEPAQSAAPVRTAIEALPMRVHTLLNRIEPSRPGHQRYGFSWTLNPYRGCQFACRYCYARYTHEWLELDGDAEFDTRIRLKQDVAAVLGRDLKRMRRRGATHEGIAIGTATDPYQPLEARYGLTRSCLEVFARDGAEGGGGLRIELTTKSNLILRDIELLRAIAAHSELTIHVTVTTPDRELARALEPGAPSPRARLETIAALTAAGITVQPFVCPLIPGLNDSTEDLETLFGEFARAGVSRVVCEAVFLRSPTKEVFLRFLEEHRPDLVARYRRRFEESAYLSPIEVERLRAKVGRLRRKFGLVGADRIEPVDRRAPRRAGPRRAPRERVSGQRPEQLGLFGAGPGGGAGAS